MKIKIPNQQVSVKPVLISPLFENYITIDQAWRSRQKNRPRSILNKIIDAFENVDTEFKNLSLLVEIKIFSRLCNPNLDFNMSRLYQSWLILQKSYRDFLERSLYTLSIILDCWCLIDWSVSNSAFEPSMPTINFRSLGEQEPPI